jgi:hypothetical protein
MCLEAIPDVLKEWIFFGKSVSFLCFFLILFYFVLLVSMYIYFQLSTSSSKNIYSILIVFI